MNLLDRKIGFAITGSFCTFAAILPPLRELVRRGAQIFPIFSYHAATLDTRFFASADFRREVEAICGRPGWYDLTQVEPIGPRRLLDMVVIAPCTGNSLAKLAHGITDTPALMAAKSQLRNGGPVLIAPSTNDALAGSAGSIGQLLGRSGLYFVPFRQDDPQEKPRSVVARMDLIPEACEAALSGRQLQPILLAAAGEEGIT